MKIVAVASVKGGTGRTTLAAHLAALLAREGQAALVVDLDPQNALGHWFGMAPGEHFGLARRGANADDLVAYTRRMRAEVPFVPFGACGLDDLLELERDVAGRLEWLRKRLDALTRGAFDVVIVDAPAGSGPFARQALLHADLVLGVLAPDGASYASVPMMKELVDELSFPREGFLGAYYLLNGYDARRSLHRDVKAALANLLEDAALPVALPVDTSVREALARQHTLFDENPDSPVLWGLKEVAEWLVDVLDANHQPGLLRGV